LFIEGFFLIFAIVLPFCLSLFCTFVFLFIVVFLVVHTSLPKNPPGVEYRCVPDVFQSFSQSKPKDGR